MFIEAKGVFYGQNVTYKLRDIIVMLVPSLESIWREILYFFGVQTKVLAHIGAK